MSPSTRIIVNAAATYGRSLLGLFMGLFTSRWVLMSLGAEDMGLYGLVAGLVTFIGFFNGMLSGSVGRFYAYAIGESHRAGFEAEGLEQCRKWFNTALAIHTIVPVVLMSVGYPIGVWAVRNWLVIPVDRIDDCVWIFRFVCLASFVGMINVPLSAMYTAKQKIAELTVYSVIGTLCNFGFVYYMVTHPGCVWLTWYAGFSCFVVLLPNILVAIRAVMCFPECRFVPGYLFSWSRVRQVCALSAWTSLGGAGYMIDIQGRSQLINKGFGPMMNASGGIAGAVSGHCATLSSAIAAAFQPAIINLAGQGDKRRMLILSYRGAKIGMMLCMAFVLPLLAEREAVLALWLKNPPPLVGEACFWTLVIAVVAQMAFGLETVLSALNKVLYVNIASLTSHLLAVAVGWIGVFCFGASFIFVFQVELARLFLYNLVGCFISTHYTGYSFRIWLSDMIFKPVVVFVTCEFVALLAKYMFADLGLVRISIVFALVEIVFFALLWWFVFAKDERSFVVAKARHAFSVLCER